ncbi:MAG: mechanosensitive ion channel family protein [Cellulosilyticaceae bacterium]
MNETIKNLMSHLNANVNGSITQNIVFSILFLIMFWIIKKYSYKKIKKHTEDIKNQFNYRKIVTSLYGGLYIIILFVIWYDSSSYIIAFIGVFTGGLAIAMKDLIVNIAGGLYILWASPFKIGDRVEIGGHIGDVIDIGFLQFSVLEVGNRNCGEQSTGRIVNIPNMQILSLPLANYEKGFEYIWNEINISVDLESDWEQAKELIYSIVNECTSEVTETAKNQIQEAGKKYLIYYSNLTPIVYTKVETGKIVLTVRYLCEPRKVRTTEHMLWEAILRAFSEDDRIVLI